MKIRVTLTVDMTSEDVDTWCREYGIDRSEVREDVKSSIIYGAQSHFSHVLGIERITGQ